MKGRSSAMSSRTPKAKSDRLDLLDATDANLSPIWGLPRPRAQPNFSPSTNHR